MKSFEYGLHIESLGWLSSYDVDRVLRGQSDIAFTADEELALKFDSGLDNPNKVLKMWNPLLRKMIGEDFTFECVRFEPDDEDVSTVSQLKGNTAFLNGEEGLHSIDRPFFNSMQKAGFNPQLFDNLFEDSDKMKLLITCQNLVLFTTGLRPEKVAPLKEMFKKLRYKPRVVIFMSEETAMNFLDIARNLKKRGTQFFHVDSLNYNTLFPIVWI